MAFFDVPLKALALNQKQCINHCFDFVKCDFCLNECPYQALYFEDNLPVVDKEKCKNCGLCQQVCPQDVFSFLLEENHFENEAFVFVCQNILENKKTSLKPCHCLYNLSVDDLFLRLINQEKLYLIYEEKKCLSCHGFDKAHFKTWLNTLFSYFEMPRPNFNFITFDGFISLNLKKENISINKRRSFIRESLKTSLKLSLDYAGEKTNVAFLREKEVSNKVSLSKKWQGLKILAQRYPLKTTTAPLPFYHLRVEICDFCAHCVRNCPTGALQIKRENNKLLLYNPTHCHNCNACLYSCPKESISYTIPMKAECLKKEQLLILYKSSEL